MRFSYDLDRALVRRGVAVTVYTSDQLDTTRRAAATRECMDGIHVLRFRNPSNVLASRMQWLSYRPIGLKRALAAAAGNYDLIHVAEARGPHVPWAFAAGRASGTPVVWSPLGGLAEGVGIRKPYRRAYDVVHHTRRLVTEAAALIAQSSHEAAVFERLGALPPAIRHIGLGIDGERFADLPPRGGFRHQCGIDPDRPLVLFMGRFHATKGLDVLVKAAAIARRTHPRMVVALVGWDHGALHMVDRLTRRLGLEDTVAILPPVFERAALQAYVDADVFAVAARVYEETSLAAMEALAAGTPCVLTRHCEVPGLQAMGGGLVTECDPESFAAGLIAILSDPTRRRALGARQSVLASQTTEQVADCHVATFRQVLGLQSHVY